MLLWAVATSHDRSVASPGAVDLTCLGVSFMCGAGIFASPGFIAKEYTGPALFLAYAVGSLSAFLSSFCYAEFTVNIPLEGAAYNCALERAAAATPKQQTINELRMAR
jgi:amino acid transporter